MICEICAKVRAFKIFDALKHTLELNTEEQDLIALKWQATNLILCAASSMSNGEKNEMNQGVIVKKATHRITEWLAISIKKCVFTDQYAKSLPVCHTFMRWR